MIGLSDTPDAMSGAGIKLNAVIGLKAAALTLPAILAPVTATPPNRVINCIIPCIAGSMGIK
jgi:hypothetical protein